MLASRVNTRGPHGQLLLDFSVHVLKSVPLEVWLVRGFSAVLDRGDGEYQRDHPTDPQKPHMPVHRGAKGFSQKANSGGECTQDRSTEQVFAHDSSLGVKTGRGKGTSLTTLLLSEV